MRSTVITPDSGSNGVTVQHPSCVAPSNLAHSLEFTGVASPFGQRTVFIGSSTLPIPLSLRSCASGMSLPLQYDIKRRDDQIYRRSEDDNLPEKYAMGRQLEPQVVASRWQFGTYFTILMSAFGLTSVGCRSPLWYLPFSVEQRHLCRSK
jgi:hypothetical protein